MAPLRPRSSHSLLLVFVMLGFGFGCRPKADTALPTPTPGTPEPTASDRDAAPASAVKLPNVPGDAVVQAIVRIGHTDNRVHDHLRHLTQKIGHRLTSSHALMEAERWTRDRFIEWGLPAVLERWGTVPIGFDRGPSSGRMVAPTTMDLVFTTPAWTPGVFGPVRGNAVAWPSSAKEVKAKANAFAGAWVLEPARPRDTKAEKAHDKLRQALRDAKVAGFVRRANSKTNLVHTSGKYNIGWSELPQDVQVSLRADQFDAIAERVGKGEEVELEFSIDNRFFRGPVPQHNVIADLVGTTYPDQYVIVGGHLDSWDGAEGANDNGTGVSTTMEAARMLMAAGARPKRTIRFMLFGGEEQGLLGSKAYVEAHPELVDKVSAVLIHDGGTNYLSGLRVTPEMMPQMQKVFAPVMALNPAMPFKLEPAEGLITGGSDHTPFIQAGIPGFFWGQDGETDYDFVHHTQHDVLAQAREDYQRHSAMVVAIAAYNLANLDAMLDRTNSAPIPWRRMDVDLDGVTVAGLEPGSKGAAAGWKAGDKILEVDGKPVTTRMEIFVAMQTGEPKKTVKLERAGQSITTIIDFFDQPGEKERTARREARNRAGTQPTQ